MNLVTPIPRVLARPLVESLQNRCVMQNHDIDDAHPAAAGRSHVRTVERVSLALGQVDADGWRRAGRTPNVLQAPRATRCRATRTGPVSTVFVDDAQSSHRCHVRDLWTVIEGIGGQNGWYSLPSRLGDPRMGWTS